jgi:hypothetical protein
MSSSENVDLAGLEFPDLGVRGLRSVLLLTGAGRPLLPAAFAAALAAFPAALFATDCFYGFAAPFPV